MKFFSLWIGLSLSLYEKLCIQSFVQNNQELTIYCDPELKLPEGVNRVDISTIIDPRKIYKVNNSYASFSNLFRYLVLKGNEAGNTWVDLDVLFVSNFDSNNGYVFGYESSNSLNNAVLAAPADSTLLRELYVSSGLVKESSWGETGPKLLTRLVDKNNLFHFAKDRTEFYPIGPWDLDLLFDPDKSYEAKKMVECSSTIHLYNEMICRAAIPKNVLPHEGSFMGYLFKEYGFNYDEITSLQDNWITGWRRNFKERKHLNNLSKILGPTKKVFKKWFAYEF